MNLPTRIGNYEPLIQLASGGMASIYVARQAGAAGFERLVVIKRVHPHLLENREFCDMFVDEARISSVIRHAGVVPVIDVAEANAELFLVLDYVESLSLEQLLAAASETGERLSPSVVSRILCDALAGLHAAHEAVDLREVSMHVVHRDVSPHNILVDTHGTSRVIDFGIAKAASRLTTTHSGHFKGKLRYMSPEQVKQQPLDRRADVFSAGIVLYEALTGRALFRGQDEGDTVLSVLVTEVPDPSTIVPAISEKLDAVTRAALERLPDERFATAARFREALEEACPPASTTEVAEIVARLGRGLLTQRRKKLREALARPSARGARTERRGRRVVVVLLSLLGAGCIAVATAVYWHPKSGATAASPPFSPAASTAAPPPTHATDLAIPTQSANPSASQDASLPRGPRTRVRASPPAPSADLHRKNPYDRP